MVVDQGCVVSCDPWFASLFGYPNTPTVMGLSIFSLIPSLSLPHSLEQMAEVILKKSLPLSIYLSLSTLFL